MGNQKKKPKTKQDLPSSQDKTPKAGHITSYYDLKPSWRVSLLETCDPFGWHKADGNKLIEIQQRLANFEPLTWKEMFTQRSGKYAHPIAINELDKKARDRLTERKIDDVEQLICLRVSKKERIWGVLDNGILNLIWWDPEHQVYPMNITDN